MTQTTTVARPPRAGAAVPPVDKGAPPAGHAAPRQSGGLRHRLRSALDRTPGQLRMAAVVGVLVCLVFAVLGGNAFRARGAALDDARADAAQLVRVQQIATDVTQADAIVTNAFLLGANEPTGTYGDFQAKVADASRLVALASKAQPGDAAALAAVNDSLSRYTASVAAARVNNRLGFQVGSGYLRQASNLLRTPTATQPAMLPTLQVVVNADAGRVDDDFDNARFALIELAVAALVVLAGLIAVQVWLARRTRRILNIPLTWGTAAVFVTIVLGAITMITSQGAADTIHDTHYAATRALSQARIAAFDGKANESLTLVYQGSGQAQEAAYKQNLATARQQVAAAQDAGVNDAGHTELETWNTVHQKIRSLDDGGNWPAAVHLATTDSTKAFNAFDDKTRAALTTEAAAVADGLTSSHWLLVALGWLTLLVGLLAAGLAWAGIGQRLGEYR